MLNNILNFHGVGGKMVKNWTVAPRPGGRGGVEASGQDVECSLLCSEEARGFSDRR